jgi:hypothetical protein
MSISLLLLVLDAMVSWEVALQLNQLCQLHEVGLGFREGAD